MKLFFSALILWCSLADAASDCDGPAAGPDCFQIGDAWTKVELRKIEDLSSIPDQLHGAIKGSVQFLLGGSGILLGRFNHQWVVATSYHMCDLNFGDICPTMALNGSLRFLGSSFKALEVIGAWPDVDLLLFTASFSGSDEDRLRDAGSPFDFKAELKSGQPLAVAAYTAIQGMSGNLQLSDDDDCKILSSTGETKLINDPDTVRPDAQKKWAFAMGCDVARGDSGGAVLDKSTGRVVGLVWTGKTPTDEFIKNSVSLEEMRLRHDEKLWSSVAYATPVTRIKMELEKTLGNSSTSANHRAILDEMLRLKY